MDGPTDYDLGTLRARRTASGLVLFAPSALTRGVWLAGAASCAVYLYSVAVSLEWLVLGPRLTVRPPTLSETPFWLLPLILGGVSLLLALGGTQLTLTDAGLELRGRWPQRTRRVFPWDDLVWSRFWDERTRDRERLYGARFSFVTAKVTVRVADQKLWEALKRFDPAHDERQG